MLKKKLSDLALSCAALSSATFQSAVSHSAVLQKSGRRCFVRLLAALLALLLVFLAALPSLSAHAQPFLEARTLAKAQANSARSVNSPLSSPAALSLTPGQLKVEITQFAKPWLAPEADLIFTLSIANGTSQELPLSHISVGAQNTVANSQYLLANWMRGKIKARSLFSFPTAARIAANTVENITVRVPRKEINWSSAEFGWGPRGIEACLNFAPDTHNASQLPLSEISPAALCDRSVTVVASSAAIQPMPVAISYPLTFAAKDLLQLPKWADLLTDPKLQDPPAAAEATDEIDDASKADTAEFPARFRQAATTLPSETTQQITQSIATFDQPGVTYFVNPAFLENSALAQALTQAKQSSKTLLPYGDVDIPALLAAQQQSQLHSALTLRAQVQKSLHQTASASAALTNFSENHIALLQELPSAAVLSELKNLGINTAIVPSAQRFIAHEFFYTQEATRKVQLPQTAAAQPEGNEFTLLLSHDQISRALTGKLTTYRDLQGLDLSFSDRAPIALALSAIYFNEAPNLSRPFVVQVPRDAATDYQNVQLQATLNAAVQGLTTAPWLKPTPLSQIINPNAATQKLPNLNALEPNSISADHLALRTPLAAAQIEKLFAAKEDFAQKTPLFAVFATFPQLFPNVSERQLSHALGYVWRNNPNMHLEYLTHLFDLRFIENALSFVPSSTINMISESSALPVRVKNDLNTAVQVRLALISPDHRLKSAPPAAITIPAQQVKSVAVPVKANGSGNIRVMLQLLDLAEADLGVTAYLNMRIRADWENLGTAILAAFFGVVLVYGIYRSVRDGRRGKPMTQAEIESQV